MAMVLTLMVATPDRLRYKAVCAGAENADIAKATLLADAVAGPLKNMLTNLASWAYPGVYADGQLMIVCSPIAAVAFGTQIHTGPDGINVSGAAASEAIVDIYRVHTLIQ